MKITIEMNCDNAAFGDTDAEQADQAAWILDRVVKNIRDFEIHTRILHDSNGNRVGTLIVNY